MKAVKFNPDQDIPDLSGKVILITGGTAGIGKTSILALAKHKPEHIYFTGRNTGNATEVINEAKTITSDLQITFIECDLSSLVSVNEAAKRFTSERLDVLLCNAGIVGSEPALTKDGYEINFGTNHLGHALLIKLLLPTLLHTAEQPGADVRIGIVSSQGYRLHPWVGIKFDELKTKQEGTNQWLRYGQSKLANILYASELARRYPSITTVSIHPGVINTGLVRNLSRANQWLIYVTSFGSLLTPEEGAYNQLWVSTTDKSNLKNGAYYEPVGKLGCGDAAARDEKLAKQVWDYTEEQFTTLGSS